MCARDNIYLKNIFLCSKFPVARSELWHEYNAINYSPWISNLDLLHFSIKQYQFVPAVSSEPNTSWCSSLSEQVLHLQVQVITEDWLVTSCSEVCQSQIQLKGMAAICKWQ